MDGKEIGNWDENGKRQDLMDLFRRNRSYRRFYQDRPVDDASLEKMIEAARFSPSSRNTQSLKYFICNEVELCAKIFPTLAWAGYLKDWNGPDEGERPSAYIVQLHDTRVSPTYSCDDGIAAESVMLEATFLGYGGCIVNSIRREKLAGILKLPDYMKIINVF
ncbi:MAG: nitroreductase family protein, partial [Bacteroidales bacterium]|nr:nitroreductase family protein [Bacteroidales bacterium]